MASTGFDGSPTPRKKHTAGFTIYEDSTAADSTPEVGGAMGPRPVDLCMSFDSLSLTQSLKHGNNNGTQGDISQPLTTSKLANLLPNTTMRETFIEKHCTDGTTSIENMPSSDRTASDHFQMDDLLARLAKHQTVLDGQKRTLEANQRSSAEHAEILFSQPTDDPYATSPVTDPFSHGRLSPDDAEVSRLKRELEMAKAEIARRDEERCLSHDAKPGIKVEQVQQLNNEHARHSKTPDAVFRTDNWVSTTDRASTFHHGAPNGRGTWAPSAGPTHSGSHGPVGQGIFALNNAQWPAENIIAPQPIGRSAGVNPHSMLAPIGRSQQPALRIDTMGGVPYYSHEPSPTIEFSRRGSSQLSRPPSVFGAHLQPWSSFGTSISEQSGVTPPMTPLSYPSMQHAMNGFPMQQMQMGMPPSGVPYIPRPIGAGRLSPMATDFNADQAGAYSGPGAWNMQSEQPPSYLSTTEPMNYRRLLERNMSCNWKYIVDKIVCNNDQQASIFLQQKLKVGTAEQKFEIVQAIIDQAYPLMINRFGNFLVQRCFEHGTPEQVIAIARAIRGNTLNLSMDAFGCHVVQKAFDCVPEEYKAIMVHELLRRIPETVIHRYACHVWEKLFELRWSDSPPQIMKYVNEALRGMWHEVALGETGSLVVQNIFENCLEEDKRPCINEVLASIDVVAHGQFGNWCIQHICEHGSIPDRTRATDHVLRFASEYSMDQFASKVVEKCLKIGGSEFLDHYLDRVCEARSDRPRMPLIDIAGDQFGNYLIQYILTHADPQRREVVAAHVRKHMVSLRGSKYGSRVAMLCCNPAFATRPGPPSGLPLTRNNSSYSDRAYGSTSRTGTYGQSYHR